MTSHKAGPSHNMVDCGSQRCASERRLLKKELLTWTKKVPLLVGLEQVAETLLGRDVTHFLLEPYHGVETDTPVEDWDPEPACQFCQSHSRLNTADPAVCCTLDTGGDFSEVLLGEEGKPLDLSTVSSSTSGPPDLDDPSDAPGTSQQPMVSLKVPQINAKIGKKKDYSGKRSYTDEELTAAVTDIKSGKIGTRRAAALYGIPRSTLRNKIFRMDNSAHCDLPGIGEPQNHHPMSVAEQLSMADHGVMGDHVSMSDLLQSLAGGAEQGVAPIPDPAWLHGVMDWSVDDWERRLEQIRRKHDLHAGLDRPFGFPPMFYNGPQVANECDSMFSLSSPYAYELKMPFLHELVRKFAEQRMMESEHCQSRGRTAPDFSPPPADRCLGAGMSAGLHSAVELKIPSYKPMRNLPFANTPMSDMSSSDNLKALSLALGGGPSCRDNSHGPGSSKINDTLKDIIAKTIAEKVRSRAQMTNNNFGSPPFSMSSMYSSGEDSPNPATAAHESSHRLLKIANRRNMEDPNAKHLGLSFGDKMLASGSRPLQKEADSSGQLSAGGKMKKSRPKRGQYRKYNSQLLLEAVRAVQRGEMSVHRAGSYFGVPHSTLEYKVKERHLLRQKKPREARKKTSDSTMDSKECGQSGMSSSSGSDTGTSTPNSTATTTDPRPAPSITISPTLSSPSISVSSGSSSCSSADAMPAPSRRISPMHHAPMESASALLATTAAASLHTPPTSMMPGAYAAALAGPLPMGFGWPPALNGSLPLGMIDPALSAYTPGYSMNMSASDLLKKLQKKAQAKSDRASPDDGQSQQPSSSNSQVIVK